MLKSSDGRLLATLFSFGENDWAVVTPEGLFDGSPGAWAKLIWRDSKNTKDFAPVEAYFDEFYYPGLLADIMAGRQPMPRQDIAQKDRRQPNLSLSLSGENSGGPTVAARTVKLKLEVAETRQGEARQPGSGAKDVRLFRNGSLMKVWRGDVLNGKDAVTLEAEVSVTAGPNRFTAYAFNRDNVKSRDAALTLTGADALRRPATAHVLAVGVNSYANPRYDLRYAVADARSFAAEVRRQQEALSRFAKVEVTTLLDKDATKANILRAFGELARKAQPEDAVVVYFAGHGTAQGERFYLIPHDLGYAGEREKVDAAALKGIVSHSVSDEELEAAFERIDAGQLLMVIDACESGQALGAAGERRGPMNSKGLAQLAYEKGMYVLTAAQSFQAAQEASQLGHGLLTFALVEEGLKKAAADAEPRDGAVYVREWLDYATRRVPEMQLSEAQRALSRGVDLFFREEERGLSLAVEERSRQHPRVFYRRELEAQPLVVARPGAAPRTQ